MPLSCSGRKGTAATQNGIRMQTAIAIVSEVQNAVRTTI
jgi:hypothetical protein